MTLVAWDASPLVHAALIDRLDVLGDLAAGPPDCPWRHVTTAAVAEELAGRGGQIPEWLDVVHVDAIGELSALARWIGRLASGTHSQGEATICAWAECHGAIVIIDDADARRVAQRHGLDVHGVLWIGTQAVRHGRWNAASTSGFFDAMIASGARYPFEVGGFESWAQGQGLLGGSARHES